MSAVCSALGTLILIILIIVCIPLTVPKFLGYQLYTVVTGSMEPEIPVGALLISKQTDIENIEKGDIVTFRSKESSMIGVIITHRVVDIHEGMNGQVLLETRGDANQYADGYFVDQSNLIGRAVYYTKEKNVVAGIFSFLTNKVGFLACIVLPCLLVGVFAMRECVVNLKAEIDAVNRELDKEMAAGETKTLEEELSAEEYKALCERLKDELLEELRQSAEGNQEKQTE